MTEFDASKTADQEIAEAKKKADDEAAAKAKMERKQAAMQQGIATSQDLTSDQLKQQRIERAAAQKARQRNGSNIDAW